MMIQADEIKNIELEARAEIAKKVGKILMSSDNHVEKKAAFELAKVLAEDVAVSVREALSRELKQCSFLPRDLLDTVARDIQEISLPFLVAAEALDDDFLEEIVRTCDEAHQQTVAKRKGLSEAVAFAIADVGVKPAVETLAENDTADLSTRSFERVIRRFPEDVSLLEKLAERADLPSEIVESIIFKISQRYGEVLINRFKLSPDYATYLVSLAKRQVFSRALELAPGHEIHNYLSRLHAAGGLDSNLLLTYLQNSNVRLFITSISVLLSKPYAGIEALIMKRDKNVLARLLDAAGFSKSVIGVLLISYERLKI